MVCEKWDENRIGMRHHFLLYNQDYMTNILQSNQLYQQNYCCSLYYCTNHNTTVPKLLSLKSKLQVSTTEIFSLISCTEQEKKKSSISAKLIRFYLETEYFQVQLYSPQ